MSFWYNDAIFYHVYLQGLCGAPFHNDNSAAVNRLREFEDWIPHITELGCTAVLFSPIFQSLTHGYDATDYFRIDSRLGSNEDFAALVQKIHDAGLKVVLDGVFNHCGRDFFAFRDVLANRESSPYRDWIAGLNFHGDNSHGDRLSYDCWSGYDDLVKYNLKNPVVKEYLIKAAKFWIETFDIDGLRLDAANVLDFDFMRELRGTTVAAKPDFWLMGEVVHGDYSQWANQDVLHSVTNYELYKGMYSSHNEQNLFELAHTLDRGCSLYSGFLPYNFADNHDQNRLASMVSNPEYLYTIYLALFTAPGLPSIYYGSEWGIRGERKNGSDAEIRPRIDLRNAQKNMPDLETYIRQLAGIRKAYAALRHGDYRQIGIAYHKPFIYERSLEDETVVIALNAGGDSERIDLGQYASAFTDPVSGETFKNGEEILLPPYRGRILVKANGV